MCESVGPQGKFSVTLQVPKTRGLLYVRASNATDEQDGWCGDARRSCVPEDRGAPADTVAFSVL